MVDGDGGDWVFSPEAWLKWLGHVHINLSIAHLCNVFLGNQYGGLLRNSLFKLTDECLNSITKHLSYCSKEKRSMPEA